MTKKDPFRFRVSDLIAVAVVICLIAGSFLLFYRPNAADAGTVTIYQDGKQLYSLRLSENRTITVSGEYENTIVIEDGSVRIESATCPGQDCVHLGSISNAGQSLICLPNRLEIRLSGESDDVDIISR